MAATHHHIQAIVDATRSVCEMMLRLPVSFTSPRLTSTQSHDVQGIVGLSGDATGSVTIGLDRASAEALATALVGAPIKCGSSHCDDAIGELTNLIVGAAKTRFPEPDVRIGCPRVESPSTRSNGSTDGAQVTAFSCSIGDATMHIEVALRSLKPLAADPHAA